MIVINANHATAGYVFDDFGRKALVADSEIRYAADPVAAVKDLKQWITVM